VAKDKRRTYRNLAVFALANLTLGLAIAFIPDMEASKRQVSLSYSMICMGATVLISMLFVRLEQRGRISLSLEAFGRNPFLIYLSAVIIAALLYDVLLEDVAVWVQMAAGVTCLAVISTIAILLYRAGRIIKTETVSIIAIIISAIAAAVVIPLGLN